MRTYTSLQGHFAQFVGQKLHALSQGKTFIMESVCLMAEAGGR